ncbi:hypothetical protein BCA37_18930 [Mycobacterium sp. djl-10]|nr:hypothetical protein BCA37_18930 [Mycobacterium sp. djl-10]
MLDLTDRMNGFGERLALVVDGDRVTYRELPGVISACASLLSSYGVRRGSRVAVLMPNSVEMIAVVLAAWRIGARVLPLNTRYRAHELRFVLADSGVSVLVVAAPAPGAPDLMTRVSDALGGLPTAGAGDPLNLPSAPALRHVVTAARYLSLGTPAAPPGQEAAGTGDGELLTIYTSGTTANPKGCVHDLTAFTRTALATADAMGVTAADVVWDPLPLFHTGGLLPLLGALQRGATFCTAAHFDAREALDLLQRERVTVAYPAFSTLVTALLDSPYFAETDLSSVRWILAIGPRGLLERVQQAIPSAIQVSCYGCTEIGGVVVYNRVGDPADVRAATAGVAFPGVELQIIDRRTGMSASSGEAGEIVVRSTSVLRGYHGDPASPVDESGWFHTGDLGRLDADGNLVYEGRLKDMLKVGGENVAASEIEFVLCQHPSVTLAAVVSIPDARLLEVPAAFVELKPGFDAKPDELIEFCAQRLASFKVPRYVRLVTEWPMSATKLQKFKLRDTLLDELSRDRVGSP